MTVISESIDTIAGADTQTVFEFRAPVLRDSDDGTSLITTVGVRVSPVGGVLTTPDLEPGFANVRVGLKTYLIDIPDSSTAVRLWPLIEAGLPVAPAQEAAAVINGGGFARGQVMTEAEYTTLTSTTTPDPGSIFFVY